MQSELMDKMDEATQTTTLEIQKQPILNSLLKVFMLAMVLANISSSMYGNLLPLYLKELNASVAQVGLFFTLSQIAPLALQILGGWISDSLGRLRSIAIGSVAGILSYVGLILSPTWQWILLGEGLGAMTRSLVGPSYNAFIAEQSEEHNRARVFGVSQTIFMIVVIVGPPLGGWLADTYGFKFMLIIAAILYTIATIIRVFMAKKASKGNESYPVKLSATSLKKNLGTMVGFMFAGGLITWLIITDGTRDIAYAMSFNLMPLYLEDLGGLSIQQIGWLSSIYGIANMIMNIPGGWISDKKGERIGIVLGYILLFFALVVFLEANTFWGYGLSWALFGLGDGLLGPGYQSLISKAVPEKVRGTAFGLMSTSLGLFSLPAPAIGGQIYERSGPRVPYYITTVVTILTVIPVWFKFKVTAREKAHLEKAGLTNGNGNGGSKKPSTEY
ncbi:MAG TPA: MFS transporter [Anaerolineaceae bacterium]|nr:MFS transporter [Anaerolineaceae bacterium]HQP09022.1 MFS transporter [Anaerolineaceae bacterium]